MQSPAAVLNAARHAVQNVGISGLTGKDRMCAELSLLKRLGAKVGPPFVNTSQFIQHLLTCDSYLWTGEQVPILACVRHMLLDCFCLQNVNPL